MAVSSDPRSVRAMSQAQNPNSQISNSQDRFYAAWAAVGEIVLAVLTNPAVLDIAYRISLLSRAVFLPTCGSGNTAAVAFLMNMKEGSARNFAIRRRMPVQKPGEERIYEFSHLTKTFPKIESAESVAPVKLKKKRPIRKPPKSQ